MRIVRMCTWLHFGIGYRGTRLAVMLMTQSSEIDQSVLCQHLIVELAIDALYFFSLSVSTWDYSVTYDFDRRWVHPVDCLSLVALSIHKHCWSFSHQKDGRVSLSE